MSDPLQIPNVWRATSLAAPGGAVVPSGFAAIDDALGGGWPNPALIEIYPDAYGIGELQLVLPLLAQLSGSKSPAALILWLNPPYQPNAVALSQSGLGGVSHWVEMNLSTRDTLWALEQAVRLGACAAVIAWASAVKSTSLRRLKLAVAASQSVAILYRPISETAQPSPANIRLRLVPRESCLEIGLFKIQGRRACAVNLDLQSPQTQLMVKQR